MALAGASVGAFTYYILTPEERRSRSDSDSRMALYPVGRRIAPVFRLLLVKSVCLRLPRRSLRSASNIFLEVCASPFKCNTLCRWICHLFRDRVRHMVAAQAETAF